MRQSRAHLRKLIEGADLMMRILTAGKSSDITVVRRLKKKRKTAKKTAKKTQAAVLLPSDDAEELLPLWEAMSDVLKAAVAGEAQLPDESSLPCIFDPLAADTDEGERAVLTALGIVQVHLRRNKPLEAVALFRLTQQMWPEAEKIHAVATGDDGEMSILRSVMFAPAFYRPEDALTAGGDDIHGNDDNDLDDDNEEDDDAMLEQEVSFDVRQYVMKFCHPRIVTCYG